LAASASITAIASQRSGDGALPPSSLTGPWPDHADDAERSPNEQVGVILSNAAGILYRAAVPPGALVARGSREQRFIYRDADAARARCGIAKIEMRYQPAHGYYRVRVIAYGDLSAATDPAMTLQLKVGDDGFVNSGVWERTASGWKLVLPGE
jgi:hypothetical protein